MDGAYAARTVNKAYRTTPLRRLWQHLRTSMTVALRRTWVSPRNDLVEYLKSF